MLRRSQMLIVLEMVKKDGTSSTAVNGEQVNEKNRLMVFVPGLACC